MSKLTGYGQGVVNDLSSRYGLSSDAVICMIQAVINGNGTMAQFNCPELGGGGQWMSGGMTMVGDMFNNGLKNTVNNLCSEIASILGNGQMIFEQPAAGQGGFQSGNWWPSELGNPSSSGSQNNIRYAIFPHCQRLALDSNGQVSVYDTQQHQIGGVSQQQGGGNSLTFSSQFGTVYLTSLPIVSGHNPFISQAPEPAQPAPQPVQNTQPPAQHNNQNTNTGNRDDVFAALEKLASLRDMGILSEQEFSNKKSELLQRL
ncbi:MULTISPECIES: SHOCT domain-containing protein [unclassified Oceanobacter]|uniref:SHOCT domain-containing protein n=1 Tax=unclassified Oceanobacter TaxID=2620260 RepID=UPI0026E1334B|nr:MULTISPECIES: SHOCT domain-containing protein [unclassified Oceanobacter]MDO6683206.1 SHOCT domain-containing protein [Oceanobacter sp. 5_MG-2023]MDP2506195.1 SHOCT domain-containing protein [Oceanobacter sp. 3_MG-2023]MDP2547264.1 SHOCT domain-containing protein [Oceanobacter sp. 4_MG-2023]MDP2607388.1 SHOCT domain-containing protein [Oceanobacter sp. 1_MG-2023]MDP2610656.1 SHOCT domain-containing protein [Oceanobacter sp. 2_MG-2023]